MNDGYVAYFIKHHGGEGDGRMWFSGTDRQEACREVFSLLADPDTASVELWACRMKTGRHMERLISAYTKEV